MNATNIMRLSPDRQLAQKRTLLLKKADILEQKPIDRDQLEDRLYDHNRRATGRDDGRGLAFVALDARGVQVGAVAGYSWAGMVEIKQLWVDENHQGRGHGRTLLEAVIAEAIVRQCLTIWVLSYDFQAPGLYEKCGFERVAELIDWPPGHSHIVLCRRLDASLC